MSDYVVAVDGLSALRDLETIPDDIKKAARNAVNYTLDRTRTLARNRMLEQVAWPRSYLNPGQNRLVVAQRASGDDLEGRIVGRFRPTSLARFVTSGRPRSPDGVTLEVEPGVARHSKRMFLIRLRAGTADLDTKSNLGLAVRLKPGERIERKWKQVQMGGGLTLLFGPSVNQVFRTVAKDVLPDAEDFMEREFLRLWRQN